MSVGGGGGAVVYNQFVPNFCLFSSLMHYEAREAWYHSYLRSRSLILRPDVTSEAVLRPDHNWPLLSVCVNHLKEAFTGQRSMGTLVIEVTKFISDLKFEISNLNNPGIIVHVASDSNFGGL